MRRFARYFSTRAFSFALPLVLADMASPCGGCDGGSDRPPESTTLDADDAVDDAAGADGGIEVGD